MNACSLLAFCIGLLKDITKKIRIKTRLIATAISASLVGYFLNAWIVSIQAPGIDCLLGIGVISIIFTIIGITGLANAYNIIDGFNSLASMVGMISCWSLVMWLDQISVIQILRELIESETNYY